MNAAMSSVAKFHDGTREVRAIGILRFSPGRLIPLNSRGQGEGGREKGQLQSLRFYKFDNEAASAQGEGRVSLFNVSGGEKNSRVLQDTGLREFRQSRGLA